ncbi:MAG: tetraacyldisaccharide 4'-kinase [Flavobacteriaceae bacterium]|nr:tetraacyldisaccharide 4'-kinase [Flavobacteriaceae bacterium]
MIILRKILFPFALLYGIVMLLRNFLYDIRVFKSSSFPFPVICVGNLSVGGTGKSPMIEYLLTLLISNYKTATLSRGYGRNSSGFHLLDGSETAEMVGDEPLQFKSKFRRAIVAVDEKRTRGISLLQSSCSPDVILLDDAFQHRKVEAGLNIILTTYNELYIDDFILPTGNLREPASGAQRAQIIVVTKCPKNMTVKKQVKIRKGLKLKDYQKLFFSYIEYSNKVYSEKPGKLISSISDEKITLVTGIANPQPLCDYLDQLHIDFEHLNFPDHHKFTKGDLNQIMEAPLVLTTEKDFMRLKGVITHPNLYYIPIKMKFLGSKALEFDQQIERYVLNKK